MGSRRPHPSLQGVITPLFTPFHEDGRLDAAGLRNLVRHLVSGGQVRSVFVRSGLGQMWQYTREDFESALAAAIEGAEGHISVFAGISGLWDGDLQHKPDPETYLHHTRELARAAAAGGAHGVVLILPYMLPGEPAQVTRDSLRAVAEVTSLPILLYQAPAVPADFWMTPELLGTLMDEVPNLVGMKLSNRRPEVFEPLAEAARGTGFGLICGDETVTLATLKLGCCGVIGEGGNTYPGLLAAIQCRLQERDSDGAQMAQEAVIRCLGAVSGLDAAIIGKQLLQRQGVELQPFGRSRPHPYSPETVETARVAHAGACEYAQVPSPYD